jgi:hypothetical protein
VVDAITQTDDSYSYQLEPLVHALEALGPNSEQVQLALDRVLHALSRRSDSYPLQSLAKAIWILRFRLTTEQANIALAPVLNAVTRTSSPQALLALMQAVQALAPELGPEQAQVALGPLLTGTSQTTDAGISQTTDADLLRAWAAAVGALGVRTPTAARRRAMELLLVPLASTGSPFRAAALAEAIASLLPTEPLETYVSRIIELLKWPTTAGPATDVLLNALHQGVPGAPGKEAGLNATVAWIAETYPNVDLTSPPEPPPSGSTGGG